MTQRRAYLYSKAKVVEKVIVLKNNMIKVPRMRVVYDDRITGKSTHKIMLRAEALDLARDYKIDLVLGN